jgi:hypothetical protein
MTDEIGSVYISLAFAIERHFPGFVDAYFGPAELKARALEGDPAPVVELVERTRALRERVEDGDLPERRRDYLRKQLTGMETVARKLAGETIPYVQEVEGCFDITPIYVPDDRFEEVHRQLDSLLPGQGWLGDRLTTWRDQFIVDQQAARAGIDLLLTETRKRTAGFVDLPEGEEVEIVFVEDQPWSAYNWYLGNFRSRVDINTDLPIRTFRLVDWIAHEAYPGHHTEHALKEKLLFRDQGFVEASIQLINTPECLISEGIATMAQSRIFAEDEAGRWKGHVLYPAMGIAGDPGREEQIIDLMGQLRPTAGNAALLRHAEGASETEVIDYLQRYDLATEQEARQRLRFIDDPIWRPYIFTYHAGRDLLSEWLQSVPAGERTGLFRIALTEQITPSWIRAQIGESG